MKKIAFTHNSCICMILVCIVHAWLGMEIYTVGTTHIFRPFTIAALVALFIGPVTNSFQLSLSLWERGYAIVARAKLSLGVEVL